jgi:hypothetical protein
MDYDELLEYLGIEDPSEFEYFENFADLVEGHETILVGALYQLLKGISEEVMPEVIEGYFNEALEACPDTEIEIYTLLELIKRTLIGLSQNCEDDKDLGFLADEILRFKEWFTNDSIVFIKDKKTKEVNQVTVMEALVISRLEKIEETEYDYDFSQGIDYSIDENIMTYTLDDGDEDEGYLETEEDDDGYGYNEDE